MSSTCAIRRVGWRWAAAHWAPRGLVLLIFMALFSAGAAETKDAEKPAIGGSAERAAGDPAQAEAAFDAAVRLYEQGKYFEAAKAFERLTEQGMATVSVLYNQGSAWFKAGQKGKGIRCLRRAEWLSPRDPDIQANLRWMRSKVSSGAPQPGMLAWFLGLLSPNEWAAGALAGIWLWALLMVVRSAVAKVRDALAGWCWFVGCVTAVLMAVALLAGRSAGQQSVVVITPEATVRFGPLEEAQTAFVAPDGAEFIATDRKGDWVEIRDSSGRRGWIASRNLGSIR